MNLIAYLNDAFLTQDQLLSAAGIDAQQLAALQRAGAMPQPSYRLRLDLACDSFFGPHSEQLSADYYAKGYPSWIGIVQALGSADAAFEVFARRYRARMARLAADGIVSRHPKLNDGLEAHLIEEWGHFLNGTYGLCTATGLPEEIAAKEVAIAIIKHITEGRKQALTEAERASLTRAVDLLDAAGAQFAPHERARSSRHRLVDEVRKVWRL